MIEKLTTPIDMETPVNKTDVIIEKIEEQLKLNNELDFTDTANKYRKVIYITGHYEAIHIADIIEKYKKIGWLDIKYERVNDVQNDQTKFTFYTKSQ